ncbi:hypothetical protein ACSRUE_26345 [Sorangium sp. KYC3313]|uniref:hypothetical protein n=1 Tax=Sorangium sp. KYC3313 TaxID=3449740 RepID=UPI003F8A4EED
MEALIVLLGGLPAALSASLFVVLHLPPTARSGPRPRRRGGRGGALAPWRTMARRARCGPWISPR